MYTVTYTYTVDPTESAAEFPIMTQAMRDYRATFLEHAAANGLVTVEVDNTTPNVVTTTSFWTDKAAYDDFVAWGGESYASFVNECVSGSEAAGAVVERTTADIS